jgi:hypothetical protein
MSSAQKRRLRRKRMQSSGFSGGTAEFKNVRTQDLVQLRLATLEGLITDLHWNLIGKLRYGQVAEEHMLDTVVPEFKTSPSAAPVPEKAMRILTDNVQSMEWKFAGLQHAVYQHITKPSWSDRIVPQIVPAKHGAKIARDNPDSPDAVTQDGAGLITLAEHTHPVSSEGEVPVAMSADDSPDAVVEEDIFSPTLAKRTHLVGSEGVVPDAMIASDIPDAVTEEDTMPPTLAERTHLVGSEGVVPDARIANDSPVALLGEELSAPTFVWTAGSTGAELLAKRFALTTETEIVNADGLAQQQTTRAEIDDAALDREAAWMGFSHCLGSCSEEKLTMLQEWRRGMLPKPRVLKASQMWSKVVEEFGSEVAANSALALALAV